MSRVHIPGITDNEPGTTPGTPSDSNSTVAFGVYIGGDASELAICLYDSTGRTKDDKVTFLQPLDEGSLAKIGQKVPDSVAERDRCVDRYLHCDLCDTFYDGICPDHPLLLIRDTEIRGEGENRARESAPAFVKIAMSKIPKAGNGVFANTFIPRGVVFGPYGGTLSEDVSTSGYAWQLRPNAGEPTMYLDGTDSSKSNWLRYINSGRNNVEQNLVAFQYRGRVYYRTISPVMKGDELLVWYGKEFGKCLGVCEVKRGSQVKKPLSYKNPFIF